MKANDANTVKISVVQSQNHVNLDQQTGQLLTMQILGLYSQAAQNAVCLYGTKAMPDRGAFSHSS